MTRERAILTALAVALASWSAAAQTPGEIGNLSFTSGELLGWDAAAGAATYSVYRGELSGLRGGDPPRCHASDLVPTTVASAAEPEPGRGFVFVVTGESAGGEEGTPGDDSDSSPRPLLGRCDPVLRTHLLDRLGFGWDEWTRDRLAAVGLDGYTQEQLDPASIDESTNTALNDLLALHDPPVDIIGLLARQTVTSVYARRQLEQQYTTFWTNHFNTYWGKLADIFQGAYPQCPGPPQCDPTFPAVAYLESSLAQFRESEAFRDLGFNGSFREILQASTRSSAVILYLDGFTNLAVAPHEDHAPELLELDLMGVDGG